MIKTPTLLAITAAVLLASPFAVAFAPSAAFSQSQGIDVPLPDMGEPGPLHPGDPNAPATPIVDPGAPATPIGEELPLGPVIGDEGPTGLPIGDCNEVAGSGSAESECAVTPVSLPQSGGSDESDDGPVLPQVKDTVTKDEAFAFAKSLECQVACRAVVSGSGDIDVTLVSSLPSGEPVTINVGLKDTSVSFTVSSGAEVSVPVVSIQESRERAEMAMQVLVSFVPEDWGVNWDEKRISLIDDLALALEMPSLNVNILELSGG